MRRHGVQVSLRLLQRCGTAPAAYRHCSTRNAPPPPPQPTPPKQAPPATPAVKFRLPQDEGISEGLGGFGLYKSSITAFMKPRPAAQTSEGNTAEAGMPCMHDACHLSQAPHAMHTTPAAASAAAATTGVHLPPHKEAQSPTRPHAQPAHMHATPIHRDKAPPPPPPPQPTKSNKATTATTTPSSSSSLPRNAQTVAARKKAEAEVSEMARRAPRMNAAHVHEADVEAAYNDLLNSPQPSKEEMWARIRAAQADRQQRQREQQQQQQQQPPHVKRNGQGIAGPQAAAAASGEGVGAALNGLEVDYLKMEEEMKEADLFHYRMGEYAFPDETLRRDYYTLWSLATSLNKARWTMLDVHAQRGTKTTGAGVKLLFWKDSVRSIVERRGMCDGIFASSHPVLRPFAALVQRHPDMTRAFIRGFTDARLKVLQQPGNLKQVADHFDKFYGYFYNSLLELIGVKDENAEHVMLHIGRATGLTLHCVMLWKKYAKIGLTMLPAQLCADHHVNLALLTNIPLAGRDFAVREILFDLMCVVKEEMQHARAAAKLAPPAAWPVVMEGLFPNYYLGFLQRHGFDVSALLADYNIENPGLTWYRMKKRWQWQRHRSLELLLDEAAPLPLIGTRLGHGESKYKVRSDMGGHSQRI